MVDYYWYKRNKLTKKEKAKRRCVRILSGIIMRIIFTPLFLLIRIYDWVWSMDYYNYLKRHKD